MNQVSLQTYLSDNTQVLDGHWQTRDQQRTAPPWKTSVIHRLRPQCWCPTAKVYASYLPGLLSPYCKLRTKFWSKCKECEPQMEGDKRGSVTYCTAREDEVNMILILSLQYYLSDRFDKRFQVSKQNSFKQLTTSKAKRVNPKSLLSR